MKTYCFPYESSIVPFLHFWIGLLPSIQNHKNYIKLCICFIAKSDATYCFPLYSIVYIFLISINCHCSSLLFIAFHCFPLLSMLLIIFHYFLLLHCPAQPVNQPSQAQPAQLGSASPPGPGRPSQPSQAQAGPARPSLSAA